MVLGGGSKRWVKSWMVGRVVILVDGECRGLGRRGAEGVDGISMVKREQGSK